MGLFEIQKQTNLKKYELAKAQNLVDKDIIHLCDFINSLENFYTTSSCAGRIAIIKSLGKKQPQNILKKWHQETVSFEEIKKAFDEVLSNPQEIQNTTLWLRQEGAILHIVARTLEDAKKLVKLARSLGWKRTGIQVIKKDRYVVEIISTENMAVPLVNIGKKRVENWEDYLNILVKLANEKHKKARTQLKKLEEGLIKNLS